VVHGESRSFVTPQTASPLRRRRSERFLAEPSPYSNLYFSAPHQPVKRDDDIVMEPRSAPKETNVERLGERIGSGRED
jgi:hypothetical protein